jgi:ParB/RepB/Spo0J family partition protein
MEAVKEVCTCKNEPGPLGFDVVMVPMQELNAGDFGIRGELGPDDKKVRELAESIQRDDLLHPLVGIGNGDGGYSLVCGHLRLAAIRQAFPGVNAVPLRVIKGDRTRALRVLLNENSKRWNNNWAQLSRVVRELKEIGLPSQDIAAEMGFSSASSLYAVAGVLDLQPEVIRSLENGEISFGYAKALLKLRDNPQQQLQALNEILTTPQEQRSVRKAETVIRRIADGKAGWWVTLKVPTGVCIEETSKGPKLVVQFDTLEDLRSKLSRIVEENVDPEVRYVSGGRSPA